ncbi:carbonic anhydrase-related protein 10 [Athalia rosae]|uniref:carbonic anhydrase-related protein 10 n=1 Tax=Athalia rosae TaxID=37344 RepID=UPI002033A6B7|nr:carbonic anhydrase-related protein 10 [Athalia rosae]XP_048512321.1 carbonic anhydrase-related protein 10 [Athalia rosae]
MTRISSVFLLTWGIFVLTLIGESRSVSWEEWWTYDGISGPAFWGLINPEWSLCNKGRRQSPVNLEPKGLLFDPNLRNLHLDKHRVDGILANTGHSVVFAVDNDTRHPVNISGGPLSYRYQFHEIHLHYGLEDRTGSEHTVDGYAFPAEIQIFGFNSQLYNNFSDALHRAQGIVAVSLLLQLGNLSNPGLRIFTEGLHKIKHGGEAMEIKRLAVRELLPNTEYYMTYDGSTTMPACHETTTWIILNKPIYITKQQLQELRKLMQGDARHPKAPLGNNYRPPQPLHHRPVRTNIKFHHQGAKNCPTMYRDINYKANSWNQP